VVNELLASALSGARALAEVPAITPSSYGYHPSWKIGHFFIAMDPSSFDERGRVLERVDRIVATIRGSRPIPGVDRVKIPGESSASKYEHARIHGVHLPESVRHKITQFVAKNGMESLLPEELRQL
jgi:ureidoglycolate dehydrogenase (NAD+)